MLGGKNEKKHISMWEIKIISIILSKISCPWLCVVSVTSTFRKAWRKNTKVKGQTLLPDHGDKTPGIH